MLIPLTKKHLLKSKILEGKTLREGELLKRVPLPHPLLSEISKVREKNKPLSLRVVPGY